MKKTSLARRYAKAFIELGQEDNSYERLGSELRDVLALTKGSPELLKVFLNPMHRLEERTALMDSLSEKMGLSDYTKRFFAILVETGNINLIDDICEAYVSMEDDLAGRIRATVVSPGEAGEDLLGEIRSRLETETGKKVILSHQKDESLLGGFLIKIGNTMLDCSISAQLERMREKTLEGVL